VTVARRFVGGWLLPTGRASKVTSEVEEVTPRASDMGARCAKLHLGVRARTRRADLEEVP